MTLILEPRMDSRFRKGILEPAGVCSFPLCGRSVRTGDGGDGGASRIGQTA